MIVTKLCYRISVATNNLVFPTIYILSNVYLETNLEKSYNMPQL